MKNRILLLVICLSLFGCVCAQNSTKQEQRKNLTVKEWKQGADGKSTRFLNHVTKYDAQGRKAEDIEYNSSGVVTNRCKYEYDANGRVSREVVYQGDKVTRIRKFEYNADGTKHKQYNYSPNGKLVSTKSYEYIRP